MGILEYNIIITYKENKIMGVITHKKNTYAITKHGANEE